MNGYAFSLFAPRSLLRWTHLNRENKRKKKSSINVKLEPEILDIWASRSNFKNGVAVVWQNQSLLTPLFIPSHMHSTSSWFQKSTLRPCCSERRTQSSIGCNLDGLELQFPSESWFFWNPLESTDCSYCNASTRLPFSRPSVRYEDALATLRDSCSLQKRQWFGCSLWPQTAVQLGCPRSFLKQKVIRANLTRS